MTHKLHWTLLTSGWSSLASRKYLPLVSIIFHPTPNSLSQTKFHQFCCSAWISCCGSANEINGKSLHKKGRQSRPAFVRKCPMVCRNSWKHEQGLHQSRSSQTMSSALSQRAFFIFVPFSWIVRNRKADHKFIQLSRFSWVVVLYNWPCTSGNSMASYNLRRLDLIVEAIIISNENHR